MDPPTMDPSNLDILTQLDRHNSTGFDSQLAPQSSVHLPNLGQPLMAAPPRGYASTRNHPPRAAPPSAISTSSGTSSTSSNATVRPVATTPRATSPTSGQIPLPSVQHNYINLPTFTSNTNGAQQTFKAAPLGRHPHWGDPAMLAQDIARLDEKTVLDGLRLRTEQTLDMESPNGLITPDMVAVARQDMHICAPALDMLLSAIRADGEPPVCEIPFIQADASGAQYADYTVPITTKNSPELFKSLFAQWTNVAHQLRALEPQFHSEIARIICDLDLSQNILVPQVMRLAADCKNMATDISSRRAFIDKFGEALLRALRESEGSTIIGPPGGYKRGPLPGIGEDDEPGSSSSSSRSSSRSSRRSRSRTHKPHHPQASWENSRHPNRPHPSTSGGGHHHLPLSRSSSSSSLRLDKDGVPLEDAELNETHFVEAGPFSKTAISGVMPRREDDHISANGARPSSAHSMSRRKQMDQYSSISPLTIPAYTTNELPSHVNASEKPIMPAEEPNLATDFPSNTDMLPASRLDLPSSTTVASFFGARGPAKPLPTSLEVPSSSTMKSRGPRPLPQRPTNRSPAPEQQIPIQPPTTVPSTSAAPPEPIYTPFVVPDQGSSYTREPPQHATTSTSTSEVQPFATFVVPSELPDVSEVTSAIDVDLQAARDRYLTDSASSLPYYHHRRHGSSSREDVSQNMEHLQHQFQNMNTSSNHSQVYHSTPGYGHEYRPPLTVPSVPSNGARRPGESNWISPTSWNDGPTRPTEVPVPPKDSGLFSGMKSWISRNHDGTPSKNKLQKPPSPPPKDGASYSQEIRMDPSANPATHGSTPFTPDSALAYYYGSSVPSSSPNPHSNGFVPPSVPSNGIQDESAYGGVYVQSVPSQTGSSHHSGYDPRGVNDPRVSPGFAHAFQANPVEASRYHGASGSSRVGIADHAYHVDRRSEDRPSFSSSNNSTNAAAGAGTTTNTLQASNGDVDTVRETMYAAIADSLATQNLRQVMLKDPQRAYFSAVSLAILNISVTLQPQSTDSPNLVTMMGRSIRISDLPGAYKTCVGELATIGREAQKLREEDDERAIAYVARGKPLPEPRTGRVRKLLERGVGYVGADGRVRGTSSSGGGTGRSREFSNKINALSVELMKLPAFQEDMLRILVA